MLDVETKSRIDSARDILVGKVPDPKSQVEQITIALIYKFMDDMDRQSEELGGKTTFFSGEFKKYRWANLLDKRLGGHERLILYAEGIEKMNVNKNIPQLFRDIFKGVFLPYRDPETLNLFLKEIAGFSYDHSERLGDAYEYLLSVLGTQGDAGQFRTPRHIIDFIVAVVDPQKNETVLDPACGTAGFLISAYKHILRNNSSKPSPPTPLPLGEGSRRRGEGAQLWRGSSPYRGGFEFAGLVQRARELRIKQTEAETFLWELLRDRKLADAKFRRQHQFGDYICDFYCHEAKLVVECDGAVHDTPDRQMHDQKRNAYLKSQGLTVIRFQNDRVLNDTAAVLEEIAANLLPSTSGRGVGGEGEVASMPGDLLTPDERARLMTNFRGYDIAPDMVRLSRANLYLHGFPNPVIHEYDALTSEERWDERCDVIMANPPFMSPKGGIRPHNRFSIKAKRSEVLFVDYIAEHLNPSGRAGIIVPEGIIFQSQNAYKALRKMLIENYLWAVVSLPAGVFNPYSGVKTSILFLDRNLAKRVDEVLFVKVENDGFDLGAQRRPIERNDLPEALKILNSHKKARKSQEGKMALTVNRKRILESDDINLSGDRYRTATVVQSMWPMVRLGEVCKIVKDKPKKFEGFIKYFSTGSIKENSKSDDFEMVAFDNKPSRADLYPNLSDVGFAKMKNTKKVLIIDEYYKDSIFSTGFAFLRCSEKIMPKYLFNIVNSNHFQKEKDDLAVDGIMGGIRQSDILKIKIPLLPLEIQRQIVAELDGYRKVIEGARQVIANYKPTIRIDPKWPMCPIGELAEMQYGLSVALNNEGQGYRTFRMNELVDGLATDTGEMKYAAISQKEFGKYRLMKGDILFNRTNSFEHVGRTGIFDLDGDYAFASYLVRVKVDRARVHPIFLNRWMNTEVFQVATKAFASRAIGQANISASNLAKCSVPLPPLAIQREIVAEIEAERAMVEANRKLVEIFEKKIQAKLAEIWGDGGTGNAT